MIADPRSQALVRNFTGQWLNIRGIAASEPVVNLFPDFDSTLREAFKREVELFFASIIQEDRSVDDLLTADYTFVNERLARHYGIPGIYGPQFRRVKLGADQDMRKGLLGKGALADHHVRCGAHVAGETRQVVPADLLRRESAGSAAWRGNQAGPEAR